MVHDLCISALICICTPARQPPCVHALELPLIGGVVSRDGSIGVRAGERCAKSTDLN
jgi:hypothetical protein